MAETKSNPRALENDPKFGRFQELYVELNGNAYKAAKLAGYGEKYAKGHAHQLAARLRLKANPVLRRYGLDEVFVARKLKKLARAKTPKWNPRKLISAAVLADDGKTVTEPEVRGGWDAFEAADVQLRATELVADLLDMKPARKITGDGPGGAIPVIIRSSIARPVRAPGLEVKSDS